MISRGKIQEELYRLDLKKHTGGRGNTSLDKKQHVSMRLYPDTIEKLEKFGELLGRNRTEIIEALVQFLEEN